MEKIEKIAQLIRYYILVSTTKAGSGHPTSSLSATDLMAVLMFGGFFRFDFDNPKNPLNDRLIFSKGHASPLFYSLYAAAGKLSEEDLLKLRTFGSNLEGHPTMEFPYTEAPTGSLGQGLSIGVGMALNAKYIDKLFYKTFVLLGDSEMSEGSQWEAMQIASYYKLDNLIGILDVNRLGQRGETMYGHNLEAYRRRISSFDWETIIVDGHSLSEIAQSYRKAVHSKDKPVMIIAKTIKGKGVSFLEDRDGWHGKAISSEQLQQALQELGEIDKSVRGEVSIPLGNEKPETPRKVSKFDAPFYTKEKPVATREAYGNALVKIFADFPNMAVLDAEVSNSTFSEVFRKTYPDRFFEMYIAEQNMVGVAVGLAARGKMPFVSTFAAFLTRAFDQIRMAGYAKANIKFCGSHSGVSIGEDGASQMGLEDIAMFRSVFGSVVLYPSDAVSTEKLVEEMANYNGLVYLRTTRKATNVLYSDTDVFPIGGSKTIQFSKDDLVTVVAAGITLHEALKAYEVLKKDGVLIKVVDLYSVKPVDSQSLKKAAEETKAMLVVEDHFEEGGIAEAVRSAIPETKTPIHSLAVKKMPKSATPQELLDYEEISSSAIVKKVKEIIA